MPQRLVSLSPNVSMILFALGADDLVVGRTRHCPDSIRNYLGVWGISESDAEIAARVERWERLPDVGAWPEADPAAVKALKPDRVFASATGTLDTQAAEMFGLDAEAFRNFDTRTLGDLDRQILVIGEIVGMAPEAQAIVAKLAVLREAALAGRAALSRPPRVLFEYCVCIKYHPEPARRFANPGRFVMAGGHLAPDLIRLGGGEPLFTAPGDGIAWTAFDAIRAAAPDIVLAFDCDGCPNAMKHPVAARPGWSDLAAVAEDAVFRPRKNIANPNLCYPEALAELVELVAAWDRAQRLG